MVKRMLIDATHAEETRVVVLDGQRLEEFDVETSTKKQLKGNIYLAKVTRVEPSLQAAFVEYGGGRHGFLAFSEIHPDYYRIPIADREALIAEAAREAAEARQSEDGEDGETVEEVGGDEFDDVSPRRSRNLRNYKIQDVITRRQIMLVQVVKEERGNKGAALTTYLSLAGRYCVLMPNNPRGGGVSRKITNGPDRKRLKGMLDEFNIPEGMAVIVRTAGMERSRIDIRRDYEYLLRLWDEIRESTLESSAPALIHEEGNLIKRAIRDLYSSDIEQILVEGEEGYQSAKSFMRMLMPSHARRIVPYTDPTIPLMHRYQVETQLDQIHSPVVQLRSGGYIVINPTEALVAIDVNSGRATRERHIEETAYKTNMEAAEEIARQVRLRDLAGLIVVDFIDMEEGRNNQAVERKMKEAMKADRARIQIGRISAFGLLELSRQRLRPSVIEAHTEKCPHCQGTGVIRSTESTALTVLRAIEEEGIRNRSAEILVYVPTAIALYLLNQKRDALGTIEERYRFRVQIGRDDTLTPPDHRLDRLEAKTPEQIAELAALAAVAPVAFEPDPEDLASEDEELTAEDRAALAHEDEADGEDGQELDGSDKLGDDNSRRRRRRRRRRRPDGSAKEGSAEFSAADGEQADEGDDGDGEVDEADGAASTLDGEAGITPEAGTGDGEDGPRRRRGKRGGRRRSRRGEGFSVDETPAESVESADAADLAAPEAEPAPVVVVPIVEAAPDGDPVAAEAPKRKRAPARKKAVDAEAAPVVTAEADASAKPKRAPRRKKADETVEAPAALVDATPASDAAPAKPARTRRPRAAKAAEVPSEETAPAQAVLAAEPPAPTQETVAPPVAPPVAPAVETVPEAATVAASAPTENLAVIEAVKIVDVDQAALPPKRGWWRR
jgi:ribonuclease E